MYVGVISRHFYSPWLIQQRTPKVMLVRHFNAMFIKRNFQWETLSNSRTWGAGGGTSSPSQRYGCKARPRLQVWISSASLLTPAVTSTGTLYQSRSHPSQAPALSLSLFALLSPPAHYGLPFASPALLNFCNAVTTAPLTAHPCFSPLFPTAIPPTSFRLFLLQPSNKTRYQHVTGLQETPAAFWIFLSFPPQDPQLHDAASPARQSAQQGSNPAGTHAYK